MSLESFGAPQKTLRREREEEPQELKSALFNLPKGGGIEPGSDAEERSSALRDQAREEVRELMSQDLVGNVNGLLERAPDFNRSFKKYASEELKELVSGLSNLNIELQHVLKAISELAEKNGWTEYTDIDVDYLRFELTKRKVGDLSIVAAEEGLGPIAFGHKD